jgi:hypothetical protein
MQAKNIASDLQLTVSWRLADREPTMSWLWDYVEVGASRRWAYREMTASECKHDYRANQIWN